MVPPWPNAQLRPKALKIIPNPGCAKFGVFLFSFFNPSVCDGPVLILVLSLSGPFGLLHPRSLLSLDLETFWHPETWEEGRGRDGSGSILASLRMSPFLFYSPGRLSSLPFLLPPLYPPLHFPLPSYSFLEGSESPPVSIRQSISLVMKMGRTKV